MRRRFAEGAARYSALHLQQKRFAQGTVARFIRHPRHVLDKELILQEILGEFTHLLWIQRNDRKALGLKSRGMDPDMHRKRRILDEDLIGFHGILAQMETIK